MAQFDLSKLMEGKNPQSVMLEQTRGLRSKWEKTGLLEGIAAPTEKAGMAVLLENQAKQLLDEANYTSTTAGNEEWSGVALPLVRRIFGEIAAKEFVSVQPMNLPSGLIFYMDFKYGSNQPGRPSFQNSSLFGSGGLAGKDSLSPAGDKLGSTQTAQGGLYGAGRFGYTFNDTTSASAGGLWTTSSVDLSDLDFDANFSSSLIAGTYKKITIGAPSDADLNAVRTFQITGAPINGGYFPQFTKVNGSNITFVVPSTSGWTGSVVLAYSKQPTAYNRGDFEEQGTRFNDVNDGDALDIPTIDLELKSEAIVAKTRKLKAVWTPELAQDLNAYHSIDAEAELTSMLSEYISLEIDLEILEMLQANALTTEYWSARVGYEYNQGTDAFEIDSNAAAASAYQKNSWFQTLGVKINKVSNKIHQLTLRGGANFIVASPDVCTILESIPGFAVSADKDAKQFSAGVTSVGNIANRYTVYKNPYMTENVMLLGYKGNNFLETGAVYAPYVPLVLTPLVYDPDNFTPRRGVMTRYAKKMVRPEFYGKIKIADLDRI
jgi:hypothetical protein